MTRIAAIHHSSGHRTTRLAQAVHRGAARTKPAAV
jgi:hypothetical protein